jgi:tripartite-type tricarboxylate transporter receptor subunit TctC
MRGLKRLGLWAVTLLLAAGSAAYAQSDYPNKPIRLVVGFTPGSVADITARVLGNRMGQILGQQIVVAAGATDNGKPSARLYSALLCRQRVRPRRLQPRICV